MEIDRENAMALKLAVRRIFETQEGELLIKYLKNTCGPLSYNQEVASTVLINTGRLETIWSLEQLNELTVEQIVEYYRKGSL